MSLEGSGADALATPPVDTSPATLALLGKIRDGDRDALNQLFALHYPILRSALRASVPPHERDWLTDDVVQETALGALQGLDRFEYAGEGAFRAWVVGIAMKRLATVLRARKAQRRDHAREDSLPTGIAAETRSPSDHAMHGERRALLEQALDSLDAGDRDLIIARRILGVDLATLAQQHGTTSEAVRLRAHRAFARLSRSLSRRDA